MWKWQSCLDELVLGWGKHKFCRTQCHPNTTASDEFEHPVTRVCWPFGVSALHRSEQKAQGLWQSEKACLAGESYMMSCAVVHYLHVVVTILYVVVVARFTEGTCWTHLNPGRTLDFSVTSVVQQCWGGLFGCSSWMGCICFDINTVRRDLESPCYQCCQHTKQNVLIST